MDRLDFDKYAIQLAKTASLRSEDPHRQVGAVALNQSKKVVGIAYNGVPSGFEMPTELLNDRDKKRPYMLHAEMNLCSLFKYGEVETVAVTCFPCRYCFINLISHGVKRVIYEESYTDPETLDIASFYKDVIQLDQIV